MKKKCLVLILMLLLLLNGFTFADKVEFCSITNLYEEEPNNNFRTANEIGENRWKKAYITSKDSSDDYFVYNHRGGKCGFDIFDIPMGCKFDLYIYDSNYRLIGSNKNDNNVRKDVIFDWLSKGTYYIRVKSDHGTSDSYYRVGTTTY